MTENRMAGGVLHQIVVVTQCRYTLLGLKALMAQSAVPAEIIQVSRPEAVTRGSWSVNYSRLLLVDISGTPKEIARSRVFLWRWLGLCTRGLTEAMPWLLLENDRGKGRHHSLTSRQSVTQLVAKISEVLLHPERRCSCPGAEYRGGLSDLQSEILNRTLAGDSVYEIAAALAVTRQSVFASRSALIEKLGLRNRMELMSLTMEDFQ
ncbi:helix-turn-helix transcriptional regulator [Salmonella enterica subsp. enterica serovar Newport]|nr:helix-turn-helix transcriptional regulator [Salmonella enterica subsp. enterica serovar Newport]EDT1690137.1 helix-turn-helix transcriptional regulator [Salmonella enterica subsp. enterica serovar Oslo]